MYCKVLFFANLVSVTKLERRLAPQRVAVAFVRAGEGCAKEK